MITPNIQMNVWNRQKNKRFIFVFQRIWHIKRYKIYIEPTKILFRLKNRQKNNKILMIAISLTINKKWRWKTVRNIKDCFTKNKIRPKDQITKDQNALKIKIIFIKSSTAVKKSLNFNRPKKPKLGDQN